MKLLQIISNLLTCWLVASGWQLTMAQAIQEEPRAEGVEIVADVADTQSVRPGINDRFVDPSLDVNEFVQRFELESREIYAARQEIVKQCGWQPGWRIADVGAGTGFFTRLFARHVGPRGWIYAIDISPRFLEHINRQSIANGISNVTSVLCSENSCGLPPASVDGIFVCDTYHHFEFPPATLASLHAALKKGGRLVVIDFERIPDKSREWIVNHVRAGKEVFRAEIENAGFEFVEEKSIDGFQENYFLVFEKRTD